LIDRWETLLATRDKNRIVRPFEWGLEWIGIEDCEDPREEIRKRSKKWVSESDAFYSYEPVTDFWLEGRRLAFVSPLRTKYPENNVVQAELFPAEKDQGRAVLVLPQWNADEHGHAGLCRLLNRYGITALRMSLAYHGRRMPAETDRADYHVSSNIGRTIHAGRQSVIDARGCLDWLEGHGWERLAVLGTSLGSCIAFIVAAHDLRVQVGVFNHVSTYFGDVVWTGLATQHIREGLEGAISQDELREFWAAISPASYIDRLKNRGFNSLLVWAEHDTTFLPCYSQQVIAGFALNKLTHEEKRLPCGHYTTGQFPFNIIDGLAMCRYLARTL
jgi:hypothetical protein